MSGKGRDVRFHGSYSDKARAVAKERETPGAYIERKSTKRGVRFLVLTRRDRPAPVKGSPPRGRADRPPRPARPAPRSPFFLGD